MIYDFLIVGSGPAGTFAAYALRGERVCVVDVGNVPVTAYGSNDFYSLKQSEDDNSKLLIGDNFESLHNIFNPYLSPKLKSPGMRFITQDALKLSPVTSSNFEASLSLARGGLANGWGAGAYRFNEEDLKGFPIKAEDLTPYYDLITEKIGISGEDDDLASSFGSTKELMPAPRLDSASADLLQSYMRNKSRVNSEGLRIGRPRLAVLTQEHDGRPAYNYEMLDFFKPHNPAVYSPVYTLNQMIDRKEIVYKDRLLVERFEQHSERIDVHARNLETNSSEIISCRKLILGAGAINSARIVLKSFEDYSTRLPILDNAISYLPLVNLKRIGAPQETNAFPICALNGIYSGAGSSYPLQLSIYGMSGTLRSDFLMDFPLAVRANLVASRFMVPAMLVAQLFYPDRTHSDNYLQLEQGGSVKINYSKRQFLGLEGRVATAFRKLGIMAFAFLAKSHPPGNSFHYAGTLGMTTDGAGKYLTSPLGKLSGTESVYIADAANFPALPSKNHTFTIMANAMRIAAKLLRN